MVKATYWQSGEVLDYKNNTQIAIEAGTVIAFGLKAGVVGNKINPGEVGALHMTGVFFLEKTAQIFQMGQQVYLANDAVTADAKTGEANNPLIGYAISEAIAGDKTVTVKLLG